MSNFNVLSERYVTEEINQIFSEKGRILAERNLWIEVMKAQRKLGLNIPLEVIEKYEKAKENIDLELIKKIELKTKHDVKARIEAFIQVANTQEHIHKGMTSRDLTDNVEQFQIKQASKIILNKYATILDEFMKKAEEYQDIILTARTHHQPAQVTFLGRRFSMWGEELLLHLKEFENFIDNYPLRGIKGPVGTQFDMLTLLGSKEKVDKLERIIAKKLGFKKVLTSTGQVYPRSLDYSLANNLTKLSSACENFAKTMRLMAGHELITEGFKEEQTGSSSMPHKINPRSCERICGLCNVLKMYSFGASFLNGNQWEEGDVSCSVLRRVVIPNLFYSSDGICETTLYVLKKMSVYEEVIVEEINKYLPFLATTELLMLAIQNGIGREKAHELIKKHAINTVLKYRENKKYDFFKELSNEKIFKEKGLTRKKLKKLLQDKVHFTGNAKQQIYLVKQQAQEFLQKYKVIYEGKEIF